MTPALAPSRFRTFGLAWVASPLAGETIVVADATGAVQSSFVSTLSVTSGANWWIVAPQGQSIVLPELPSALAGDDFAHGDSITIEVALFDGDVWSSYADVKAVPTWHWANTVFQFLGTNAKTVLASEVIGGVTVP